MTRPTTPWFEVAAFAVILVALLAIVSLAMRPDEGLAMAISTLSTFFCVFMGIAVARRRTRRRDPVSVSIKDELQLRKLRSQGARAQFR